MKTPRSPTLLPRRGCPETLAEAPGIGSIFGETEARVCFAAISLLGTQGETKANEQAAEALVCGSCCQGDPEEDALGHVVSHGVTGKPATMLVPVSLPRQKGKVGQRILEQRFLRDPKTNESRKKAEGERKARILETSC